MQKIKDFMMDYAGCMTAYILLQLISAIGWAGFYFGVYYGIAILLIVVWLFTLLYRHGEVMEVNEYSDKIV